ncbi:MAG: hypothetical protein JSS02_25270 [Planctomycetes bacterium]|nr:hypothetical protein [Planctomycetota bacterium]
MRFFLSVGLILAVAGCSQTAPAERLAISDVPENLMVIARNKLPGVEFDQVIRKSNGIYEIIGKDSRGKVREIERTP